MARAPTAASNSDLVKKLMERIDALEARLKSIEGQTQLPAKAAEPPAPAPGASPQNQLRPPRLSPTCTTVVACSADRIYSPYSRRVGQIRPYTCFQFINASANDPAANTNLGNWNHYRGVTAGVRYDFLEFSAFKVEWEGYKAAGQSLSNRLAAQIAFTF